MDTVNQPVTPPQTPDQMHSSFEDSHHSKVIPIIIGAVLLVLVGVGSYVLGISKNKASTNPSTQALRCEKDFDCVDDNVCTDDICTKGVCSNPNSIEGKSCGANLPDVGTTNFCDGAGKCVYRGPIQPGPIDETANWKTYNSTKGSFSIKYPGNWPLVNALLPNDPNAPLDDIVFSSDYKANSGDSNIAFITAAKQGGYPTLNEYLNTIKQDSSIIDIKDVTIGGEKAVSYRRSGGMGTLPIIEYAVFKNGVMHSLVLEDSSETNKNRGVNIAIFNQILSTFQFSP